MIKIRIRKTRNNSYIIEEKRTWYCLWEPVQDHMYSRNDDYYFNVKFSKLSNALDYINERYGLLYDLDRIVLKIGSKKSKEDTSILAKAF